MAVLAVWRLGFAPFFLRRRAVRGPRHRALAGGAGRALERRQPVGGWLAWHRHEMLFGFGVAIIAGFLLTAGGTWTSVPVPAG
ncbi:NnrS family protein [Pseudomonas aeruginosa]|nr:NnrS family protein [Pseudomonas aeruginosa]